MSALMLFVLSTTQLLNKDSTFKANLCSKGVLFQHHPFNFLGYFIVTVFCKGNGHGF